MQFIYLLHSHFNLGFRLWFRERSKENEQLPVNKNNVKPTKYPRKQKTSNTVIF